MMSRKPRPAARERAPFAEDRRARTFVLAALEPIVQAGGATMRPTESGAIELSLPTGEIFLLGEERILRVA